jgi:CheY-like chemotaxis protein
MDVCRRCQGLMMPERVWDGRVTTAAWRCLVCGEFVDEVIQRNRISPRPRERQCRTSVYAQGPRFKRAGGSSLFQPIGERPSISLGAPREHIPQTISATTTVHSPHATRPEEIMNDTLASGHLSFGRVLVVDSSEVIRLTVRLILARKGYQIVEATCGQEALTALEHGEAHIDMILCDTEIKGTDGLETVPVLCKRFPSIPLVIIGEPDRVVEVLAKYRVADHLLKPLAERRMLEVVQAVARLHPLHVPQA